MKNYKHVFDAVFKEMSKVIVGQEDIIEQILVAILCDSNALLEGYPQVVHDSLAAVTTHKIAQFLLQLASEFNAYYHEVPVLQAETQTMEARLALVEAVSIVLQNALHLLAIDVLERM